jgi:protein-S-isoprenylcysteine O-methyltransferase Ste14
MSVPLFVQFLLCPVVLISLLLITAPYGRHLRPGWGPALPSRAAWFLMELPALLVLPLLVLLSPARSEPAAWLPLLFWLLHYAYRTLLFPALMRPSGNTFPLLLVAFAIGFNVLNGYNNADALLADAQRESNLLAPHVLAGGGLFLAGFLIHCQADRTIRALRQPGDRGYRIPRGGLFRWVGSPQYLGEIIQWCGWAIMTWSLAGLAFALFTVCNLAPRAIANHRWYQQHFADYPRRRRILVPGIF